MVKRIFARKLKTYLSSTMGGGDWNFDRWLSFVGLNNQRQWEYTGLVAARADRISMDEGFVKKVH